MRLSIMYSFSATSANIAINDISLKIESLDYILVGDIIFNHYDVTGPCSYLIR